MKEDVKKDLDRAKDLFEIYVAEKIKEEYELNDLINVEGSEIDTHAGIDYLGIHWTGGLVTFSARVCDLDYKTYTVRAGRTNGTPTEYAKRRRDINYHFLYPDYHIQAYCLSYETRIAIVKTVDIIQHLEETKNKTLIPVGENGEQSFYAIEWDKLKDKSTIFIIKKENNE